jgi:uncharacterized Rmd1/YagE family protein
MGDLLGLGEDGHLSEGETIARADRRGKGRIRDFLGNTPEIADIFIFKYGTVVIWGMTEEQEQRFLASM